MTTIAWDGETLATDTQSTTGSRVCVKSEKVFVPSFPIQFMGSKVAIMGMAGTSGDERHVINYLQQLEPGLSEKEMHAEVSCRAIIILCDGRCFDFQKERDNRLPWIYESYPPHAIGSGADFAIAAMHLGKNSAEAVELSIKLDAYTGGEVICYNYKG